MASRTYDSQSDLWWGPWQDGGCAGPRTGIRRNGYIEKFSGEVVAEIVAYATVPAQGPLIIERIAKAVRHIGNNQWVAISPFLD